MSDFMKTRVNRVLEMSKTKVPSLGEVCSHFPDMYWSNTYTKYKYDKSYDYCNQSNIAVNPLLDKTKVWNHVLACPYSRSSTIPIYYGKDKIQQPKVCNKEWDEILVGLNHVGRPSGEGEFLRPEGKYLMDLTKEQNGYQILEAAHVIAHARALANRNTERMQIGFLECLAEVFLSKYLSLPIYIPTLEDISNGEYNSKSLFTDLGIKVVVSTAFRNPWLTMNAVGEKGPIPFKTTAAVLVNIHLEPQPYSAREDNPNSEDKSWLEMNRWSCMPSILNIAGWKSMDELMKAPLVYPFANSSKDDVCVKLPVSALDEPSTFIEVVNNARESIKDTAQGWLIDDFMSSKEFKRLKNGTPPFPCKECLKLNMASDGAPTKPLSKRPNVEKNKKPTTDAEKEWAEYDKKIDKIIEVVKKSCSFYYKRFCGESGKTLKLRQRNYKKLVEILEKIKKSKAKREKLVKKLEYTKAMHESEKIKELSFEITSIIGGK